MAELDINKERASSSKLVHYSYVSVYALSLETDHICQQLSKDEVPLHLSQILFLPEAGWF